MVSLELEARLDNLLSTAQEETSDIDLFAPITEREECPICLLPLPIKEGQIVFMPCCGKDICKGCICKQKMNDVKNGTAHEQKCAFCRQSPPNIVKAIKKLMKKNNPDAFMCMAFKHKLGEDGVLQSDTKALEMFIRAAELGHANAFEKLGYHYQCGIAVEQNISKAMEFYEVGAKKGSVNAHGMLAIFQERIGNINEGIEHKKVLASAGDQDSMDGLMKMYKGKLLSKEDMTITLRAFQASSHAMKSKDRDAASKVLGEFAIC